MKTETNFPVIKIGSTPVKLSLISDVYLVYHAKRYLAAVDFFDSIKRTRATLFIGASTFAIALEKIRAENDKIEGAEIWVQKESDLKTAKYIISET